MEKYVPEIIEVDDIKLPEDIISIAEIISKNVHEVWSKMRLEEGWVYGEKRDDDLKTNPCLVPYEDLPESEKEYDRNTALRTLKLLMKLGYKLVKE